MASAERSRVEGFGQLENGLRQASEWYLWGPYLSERQWGTVREDYSADGDAWAYLPHDHARSRAYRWGEDGMAGFSDIEQRLCLGLALWNGRDPILKERMFGLTGAQANHGEDVKEYWWYLDALPSHAWNRWRYHYPQAAFPYDDLIAENGRRGKLDPEYELLDTGVVRRRPLLDRRGRLRQGRSHRPDDGGPGHQRRSATPTRCTCCRRCGSATRGRGTSTRRSPACGPRPTARSPIDHPFLGDLELLAGAGPDGAAPAAAVLRERDQRRAPLRRRPRRRRTRRTGSTTTSSTARATVNPDQRGDQGGLLVPAGRRAREHRRAAAAAASGCRGAEPAQPRRARRRLRRGRPPPPRPRPTSSTPS